MFARGTLDVLDDLLARRLRCLSHSNYRYLAPEVLTSDQVGWMSADDLCCIALGAVFSLANSYRGHSHDSGCFSYGIEAYKHQKRA